MSGFFLDLHRRKSHSSASFKPLTTMKGTEMSIQTIKERARRLARPIAFVRAMFPFAMAAVGYLIPPMRVSVGMPDSNGLWLSIVIELVIAGIWIASEMFTMSDRNTTVRYLQWDDGISLAVALVMAIWFGWLLKGGDVQWWFVIPFVAAVFDAFFSGYLAINNAAQKPIAQLTSS